MSRDCLHVALLAQVPDLHCVVVTSSCDLIAVRQELDRDDLFHVGRELKDVLATPEVPYESNAMEVTGADERAITLEAH